MQHDIPAPNNPAVVGLLKSPEMRSLMQEVTEAAQALYRAEVAKRSGALSHSARVETFVGGRDNDRWCGRLTVGGLSPIGDVDYGASHEFGRDGGDEHVIAGAHDLNRVLNLLGQL
ncbi:hypothetical protein [Nocardia cyriacigeorgica]|uniref:hypothetical protein n=1 Tax=Nocardia cyriacigeorgica TaxID=135487 RepID=UPI0024548A43|nr:hypothetical protein [Nocardia cyriacigeorgica]